MDRIQSENRFDDERITGSDADMGAAEEPEEEKTTRSALGYRLLAALFLFLAVGGLFLGLLGKVLTVLAPVSYFTAYGTSLGGSLAGYAVDYIKYLVSGGFSASFSTDISGVLASVVNLALLLLLVVSVIIAVVTFIVALVSGERAKGAAFASGTTLFLAYGGLFLWSYFMMSLGESVLGATAPTHAICDVPTAIIATVALLFLAIAAIASDRRNFFNVLLLAASLLVAFLVCYPGSLTIALPAAGIFSFSESGGGAVFASIALLFFMAVIAFNVFVSVLRVRASKHYAFDAFRFALLLFGALLTVIAFIAVPVGESRWAVFKGQQLYYTIGILVLILLAFTVSVILAVRAKRAAILLLPEADAAGAGETVEGAPAVEPETPAESEPEKAAPQAEEPAPVTPPAAAPFAQEAPISEFERRMEALARGEQPDYAAPQTAQPQPYLSPAMRNMMAQQRSAGYADANQYTYDPFINSLTPQEKNEFGDLFIACKTGKFEGLPTYAIGGNNEEFFRKVFIYLGKFRKDISAELLDKLYLFVSKNA